MGNLTRIAGGIVLTILMALPALAQSSLQTAAVKELTGSAPLPDHSYELRFSLEGGSQLTLKVPGAEAIKVISALSAPTGAGSTQKQVAVIIQKVSVGVNENGSILLIVPTGAAGQLEPLALPTTAVEPFIRLLQQKLGEARSKAANTSK